MYQAIALTFLSWTWLVNAGSVAYLGSCSQSNNILSSGSYQFSTDCNSQTYCADNSTCLKRECRRDDFPFGYSQGSNAIPPKCPRGQFCPDEMDTCQDLLPVGSPCQLNRDDECQAPPNFAELADNSFKGRNVNGSVCLNNTCMWANRTLGDDCFVENTAYIAYGVNGEFIDIVSRGDCRLGLYCDSQSLKCMEEKPLGASCSSDKECESWNCQGNGVCGDPADTPRRFPVWVYVVVGVAIFGGLFGVLVALFIVHRKQRDVEREKRMQYWREQNAFHQNLMQMRQAARASIISTPNNGGSSRSTMYDGATDESGAPMLSHTAQPTKSSGLRNYTSDDGSSEWDDMGLPRREDPGRF